MLLTAARRGFTGWSSSRNTTTSSTHWEIRATLLFHRRVISPYIFSLGICRRAHDRRRESRGITSKRTVRVEGFRDLCRATGFRYGLSPASSHGCCCCPDRHTHRLCTPVAEDAASLFVFDNVGDRAWCCSRSSEAKCDTNSFASPTLTSPITRAPGRRFARRGVVAADPEDRKSRKTTRSCPSK